MTPAAEARELEKELNRNRAKSESFRQRVFDAIAQAEAKGEEWTPATIADQLKGTRSQVHYALLQLQVARRLVEGTQRITRPGLVIDRSTSVEG